MLAPWMIPLETNTHRTRAHFRFACGPTRVRDLILEAWTHQAGSGDAPSIWRRMLTRSDAGNLVVQWALRGAERQGLSHEYRSELVRFCRQPGAMALIRESFDA